MTLGEITAWLLDGDPAIRWQTKRDLLWLPEAEWAADREVVATEGWGARLLALQEADGTWAGSLYSRKWISTTYTLLLLRHLGLSSEVEAARRACGILIDRLQWKDGGIRGAEDHKRSETCVTGMGVSIAACFGAGSQSCDAILHHILGEQLADGGWNCRRWRGASHSSFHTTISVLEGLQEYAVRYPGAAGVGQALAAGQEFLLAHRIFRSHRTGEVVDARYRREYFPPRWHYDYLRALEYLAGAGAMPDPRAAEAIELLHARRQADGRWKQGSNWPGQVFFEMEPVGQPGRWNTLRALRVLRWWGEEPAAPGS